MSYISPRTSVFESVKSGFLSLFMIVLLFSTLFVSCKEDPDSHLVNTMESLSGKWSLVSAMRNGEPTESLDRAKIEFVNSDTLQSNLFDENVKTTYTYKKTQLEVLGTKTYTFDVRNSGQDTLYLIGKVGNSDLHLQFLRVK